MHTINDVPTLGPAFFLPPDFETKVARSLYTLLEPEVYRKSPLPPSPSHELSYLRFLRLAAPDPTHPPARLALRFLPHLLPRDTSQPPRDRIRPLHGRLRRRTRHDPRRAQRARAPTRQGTKGGDDALEACFDGNEGAL